MTPAELEALAYRIADRCAVSDIETEAAAVRDEEGLRWYDVRPMLDPREFPPEWIDMAQETIAYSVHRGLVERHPKYSCWVRVTRKGAP